MKKKQQAEDTGPSAPGWMVTYGDMMTLLLTFFVLLLSFSSIQESKFHEAVGSLQNAFGVMAKNRFVISPEAPPIPTRTERAKRELESQMQEIQQYLTSAGISGHVEVVPTQEGYVIRLNNPLLFDSGSADIKEDAVAILETLVDIVKEFENTLRVEGHTDNVPINNTRFPSNWELSTARALSILKTMSSRGIEPTRLAAAGYGEFKPLVANDSDDNKEQNRRVEIHVVTDLLNEPAEKPWFLEEDQDG